MPATYAGTPTFSYGGTSFLSYAAGTAEYPSSTTYPGLEAYPGLRSLNRSFTFGGTGAASYASDGIATYD